MEYSGMLLGIATVLVWMGVIRYFEYFERYNVSSPNDLKLCICYLSM